MIGRMRTVEFELAEVSERLRVEFTAVPHLVIRRVVRGCRHDLDGVPEPALPELLERRARERLRDGDRA